MSCGLSPIGLRKNGFELGIEDFAEEVSDLHGFELPFVAWSSILVLVLCLITTAVFDVAGVHGGGD